MYFISSFLLYDIQFLRLYSVDSSMTNELNKIQSKPGPNQGTVLNLHVETEEIPQIPLPGYQIFQPKCKLGTSQVISSAVLLCESALCFHF